MRYLVSCQIIKPKVIPCIKNLKLCYLVLKHIEVRLLIVREIWLQTLRIQRSERPGLLVMGQTQNSRFSRVKGVMVKISNEYNITAQRKEPSGGPWKISKSKSEKVCVKGKHRKDELHKRRHKDKKTLHIWQGRSLQTAEYNTFLKSRGLRVQEKSLGRQSYHL